jgi:hypothetical protein
MILQPGAAARSKTGDWRPLGKDWTGILQTPTIGKNDSFASQGQFLKGRTMPTRLVTGLVTALLLPTLALYLAASLLACAVAPSSNVVVEIADESAIIIWDKHARTEHFIRRASFRTDARDFGFLVPTPTKPDLEKADDEAFTELSRITAPVVVTRPRPSNVGCACGGQSAPNKNPNRGGKREPEVRVLEEKRVAGYDAAILEANDADALGKWLTDHGYDFSPALKEWVKPYLKRAWKINAFKVAKDNAGKEVATAAVRLSFKTEQPFFPYREPPNQFPHEPGQPQPRRLLRVYFVASERMLGTLGKGQRWPAHVPWAGTISEKDRAKVLALLKLPEDLQPPFWWLTEFEDHSSPRPGSDDVYFSRSREQTDRRRPEIIRYVAAPLPGDLMCYALAACILLPPLLRRLRRR